MKTHLTAKEKTELKAKVFQEKLDRMAGILTGAGMPDVHHQRIMTFYRWLCFDVALKSEIKESERMDGLVQKHMENFDIALADGIRHISKSKQADIKSKALDILWGENSRS